jgi:hypothetical protein
MSKGESSREDILNDIQSYLKAGDTYMGQNKLLIDYLIEKMQEKYRNPWIAKAVCNEIHRHEGLPILFPEL